MHRCDERLDVGQQGLDPGPDQIQNRRVQKGSAKGLRRHLWHGRLVSSAGVRLIFLTKKAKRSNLKELYLQKNGITALQ